MDSDSIGTSVVPSNSGEPSSTWKNPLKSSHPPTSLSPSRLSTSALTSAVPDSPLTESKTSSAVTSGTTQQHCISDLSSVPSTQQGSNVNDVSKEFFNLVLFTIAINSIIRTHSATY